MRRPALYSSSRTGRPGAKASRADAGEAAPGPDASAVAAPARAARFSLSNPRLLWAAIALLAILLTVSSALQFRPSQRRLTQEDINAAVLKTLETNVMPSEYAKAYDTIRPSVVRVMSYVKRSRLKDDGDKVATSKGSRAKPKALGPAKPTEGTSKDDEEVEHGVGRHGEL